MQDLACKQQACWCINIKQPLIKIQLRTTRITWDNALWSCTCMSTSHQIIGRYHKTFTSEVGDKNRCKNRESKTKSPCLIPKIERDYVTPLSKEVIAQHIFMAKPPHNQLISWCHPHTLCLGGKAYVWHLVTMAVGPIHMQDVRGHSSGGKSLGRILPAAMGNVVIMGNGKLVLG